MLPPEETARITRRLDLNERLVWAGRPKPTAFAVTTVFPMLFGVAWCSFVSLFIVQIVGDFWGKVHAADFQGLTWAQISPLLFMLPFVLAGLATLGAPLWHYLAMAGQRYAVTDKRALIVGRFFTRSRRRAEITCVDRADHRNGLTDLFFASSNVYVNGQPQPFGFRNLPTAEALAAERALRALTDGQA